MVVFVVEVMLWFSNSEEPPTPLLASDSGLVLAFSPLVLPPSPLGLLVFLCLS